MGARRSYLAHSQRLLLHGQAAARSRSTCESFPTKTRRSTCCGRTPSTTCSRRRSRPIRRCARCPTSNSFGSTSTATTTPAQPRRTRARRSARSASRSRTPSTSNELVRTLTFGTQTVATEDIPDWMWAFNPRVPVVRRTIPHWGARLLREAGWTPGPDGIMRKDDDRLCPGHRDEQLERDAPSGGAAGASDAPPDRHRERRSSTTPATCSSRRRGWAASCSSASSTSRSRGGIAGIDPDDSTQLTCENLPPGGYNYSRYCSQADAGRPANRAHALRPPDAHVGLLSDSRAARPRTIR